MHAFSLLLYYFIKMHAFSYFNTISSQAVAHKLTIILHQDAGLFSDQTGYPPITYHSTCRLTSQAATVHAPNLLRMHAKNVC